ncbi:SDR family oxidoreductase [Herbaspirillum sp. RV1423]|uniref:SDR family NAD(P)-dependent oxidoreductase n=1 Tax=Herbaspirillum sp. RV1423 TaxID=1443993 RepID=UPI0004B2FFE6|nr:SDR family oxidoreductase [Herbaspirillum sp. RV1423]
MSNATSNKSGTAVITGASTGIGATYADRLAHRGYDLILVARDVQRLEKLAERLRRETAVKVEVLPADLVNKADLLKVEQRLRSDASVAMLVNNAGMAIAGELADGDVEKYDAMIQLNITAVLRLAAAVAPGFIARKGGTLINIASVLALAPEMFNGAYSGTKAFVLNLSQSLQNELGKHGVRVQAVLPGATRTEIWERSGTDIEHLPEAMLMGVDDLVNAALAGLDLGEQVTIPSLPDVAQWEALTAARQAMGPNLSLKNPAARYRQ